MSDDRPASGQARFPPSFGAGPRRSRGPDFDDDLESMRERMDRDREAFFANQDQRMPDRFSFFRNSPRFDSGFGDTASRPTSQGFRPARTFSERFSDMGNFPEDPNMRQGRSNSPPRGNDVKNNPKLSRKESTYENQPEEPIPIRVIHAKPKHKYENSASRNNTTQLPAKEAPGSSGSTNSPRLERAHSEPPKTFTQKLKTSHPNFTPPIPENSEPSHQNLATSNSSPSVPSGRQENITRPSTAPPNHPNPPAAPPRRNVPKMEPEAVRHIPIFVEGRDEPIFNRRLSEDSGVSRKSSSEEQPKIPRNHKLHVGSVPNKSQEPTSPLSPPPGPIPMGYAPSQPEEPISPQPFPSGVPIPMPCSPNLLNEQDAEEADGPRNVFTKDPEESSEDVTKKAKVDPDLEKLLKVKDAVAGLQEKIKSFKGSKTDKEYLYLDEMLTRHMLSLDCIEAGGRDDIRQMRKETIKSINRCISTLDANARNESSDPVSDQVLEELVNTSNNNNDE